VKKSKIASETRLIEETMIFACHSGARRGHIVGITSQDAIPLAFSHDIESAEFGLNTAYECFPTFGEFFHAILGRSAVIDGHHINSGIWTYVVEYEVDLMGRVFGPTATEWKHLQGGKLRRPSGTELSFLTGDEPTAETMGWVLL
jgi:hypothetical protein